MWPATAPRCSGRRRWGLTFDTSDEKRTGNQPRRRNDRPRSGGAGGVGDERDVGVGEEACGDRAPVGNFTPAGGGEGDIDTRVLNFLAGPQVRFPNQTRATPFLRARFGVANTRFNVSSSTQPAGGENVTSTFSTSATDFAMALGGGPDVRVGERVALRVFQIDYNPVFLRDRSISVPGGAGAIQPTRLESNRQDNIRLGFGVTFK